MTGILLQVRLHSTRLSGKALLPLPGGTVIEHTMRALKEVPVDCYILVTEKKSIGELAPYAEKEGFETFVGPEDDVLLRYVQAARHFHLLTVIRATGDNPLVSPLLAREILVLHKNEKADLSHFLDMPLGLGVEVVETSSLEEAEHNADDPYEREHLTTHLYRHPGTYKIIEPQCGEVYRLPGVHISLDTKADYEVMQALYADLYRGKPISAQAVVQWLKKHEG
jgi:spore coat polysaccharide biosynthesis protein SpsF